MDTQQNSATNGRVKLTKKVVDEALNSHVKGKRRRVWDRELSQLYLLVTPAGKASYCIRYERPGGIKGDFTIGSTSIISPDVARQAAVEHLARLKLHGVDPVEHRRRSREKAIQKRISTVEQLVEEYWTKHSDLRASTRTNRESLLKNYILPVIGKKPIEDVTEEDIEELIKSVPAKVAQRNIRRWKGASGYRQANHVHEVLKAVFNWAVKVKKLTRSPTKIDKQFDDRPIKRIYALNDQRFRAIWQALSQAEESPRHRPVIWGIKLCILTLQRPNEVSKAHLKDFNWSANTWQPDGSRTKTWMQYFVPLTDESKKLFQNAFEKSGGDLAFPKKGNPEQPNLAASLSNRLRKIIRKLHEDGKLDTTDIVLYDFRRYGRTLVKKRLKFPKEIAEFLINHKQPSDISNLYDMEDYHDEIRDAAIAWGEEIKRIVS